MEIQELRNLRELLNASLEADLAILNVNVLDPYMVEFRLTDMTIHQGKIVAMKALRAKKILDAQGKYACPLLIDAHMHIESTTVLPSELNDFLIPRGVGMLIADPHEIANVAGLTGIDFMLDASEKLDLDVRVMLPSCVPATAFEHAGASLGAEDLRPYLSHPRVLGLAEVMDKDAVRYDEDMLYKIGNARAMGKNVDGHGANLDIDDLDLYSAMGINSDHECVSAEEARERVRRGFYVFMRQGSVADNLADLLPAVTLKNFRRFCFCTDDKHPDDLLDHGGVDAAVKEAIRLGLDHAVALTMATHNAATCYRLATKGALSPGYDADFFLFRDLDDLTAERVIKGGEIVAENGRLTHPTRRDFPVPDSLANSVNFAPFGIKDLAIWLYPNRKAHVMNLHAGNVLTTLTIEETRVDEEGFFQADVSHDLSKLCVIERHHAKGNIGCCPIRGFKLKHGAIASTVAHDSHNLVVVSTNDADVLAAAHEIKRIGGGYVVVQDGIVLASVPLEIGGLLSAKPLDQSIDSWRKLHEAFAQISDADDFNPFLMLSFMSLPVIPDVKCTDIGLIDVARGKVLDIAVYEEEK